MIQYLQYAVVICALIQLFGYISYVKSTLVGKTKPNKISWLLWSVSPLIATVAAISDGVNWVIVLPSFMAGFGPLLVFCSSFVNKDAHWQLGKFDYICGICSILALILWGITKEPVVAIVFSILSDGFAAIPNLAKAWKYPETENVTPYITELFTAIISFFTIRVWSFSAAAFIVYLIILDIALIFSIYKNKIFKSLKNA